MPVALRPTKLLLLTLTWVGLLVAAPTAAAAPNLRYWGGPVAHSMNVHLVEWGSGVRSTYTDPHSGDPAFFGYLAGQSGTTTDIGGVLAQYMDTTGANSQNQFSYGGLNELTPPTTGGVTGCSLPGCVDDSIIQSELRNAINANALPAPTGDGLQSIYVVLFPPGTNVCQAGTCAYGGFCAYHGSFPLSTSTHVLYAAMVDNGPNTPNAGGCGTSTSDIANQTAVVSHEVAETINDPLVAEASAYGPPLGWYDKSLGEIADICVGATEQALNGSWTVQNIWSNLEQKCVAGESAYSAPTATFLANSTGAPGQQMNLDASGSSDPSADSTSTSWSGTTYSISSGLASYSWDWGDGSTSAPSGSATASHTYASTGNYQVSLTVKDNLGFTSTVTHEVSITAAPVVNTGAATGVDDQGATVNGTINPENQSVQYKFVYGTSASALDQATPLTAGPTGETASPVSATLSGLAPSTTYYYELDAVAGGQTYTDDPPAVHSFTTSAAPPPSSQSPTASTGGATQITVTSAQLAGTITPGGPAPVTYWFTYGTSPTNLDRGTPQATQAGGSTPVPVTATISGLSSGTTYYYTLNVSLNGKMSSGAVNQFTTLTPPSGGTTPPPPSGGTIPPPASGGTTPPSVTTGPSSQVTSSGATVAGSVNPKGAPTTYQVQFGPSASYGYSSAVESAGSGTASVPVQVSLSGLKPGSTYHYRFVASNSGATAVGADGTFTTARALAAAPRFSFRVLGHPALAAALRSGLKVRFTCSRACVARFSVVALPGSGVLGVGAFPLSIASGTGRLRAKGSGTAVLRFSGQARRRFGRTKLLRVGVSGVAGGRGTATTSPLLRKVTLRRVRS